MNKTVQILILSLFALTVSGCAQLKQTARTMKPTAKISDSRLTGINFEQADLVFDVMIDNPNPASFKLTGIAYEIKLEDQSLFSGKTAQGLKVKKYSQSKVEIPITLKFKDLKKLPGKLREKDRISYQLVSSVSLNLPVVGNYPIHLKKTGELPLPRLPEIKLKNININKLSLTSAELITHIEIHNPNNFSLGLSNFNYQLVINNQTWGQGKIAQKQQVPKKGTSIIDIPVTLNILNMGKTAYQLLNNKQSFDYQLSGGLNLDTGINMLKNVRMPLNIKGKASLN